MRICNVEGCGGKHEAKGFCKRHYRSFLKYGDELYVDRKKAENEKLKQEKLKIKEQSRKRYSRNGTCVAKDCDKPIQSRKLCATHYNRLLRNGHLQIQRTPNAIHTDNCLVINCNNPHKRHGFCSTHLVNVRELKTPFRAKTVKLCGVQGCEKIHYALGTCIEHYQEWKKIMRDNELAKYSNLKAADE